MDMDEIIYYILVYATPLYMTPLFYMIYIYIYISVIIYDSGLRKTKRVIQEFPNYLTELISALKAISPNKLKKLEDATA
jgi:hypothetical protein